MERCESHLSVNVRYHFIAEALRSILGTKCFFHYIEHIGMIQYDSGKQLENKECIMVARDTDNVETFPLGNANSTWITTPRSNRLFIFDYADTKTDDSDDRRWDSKEELFTRVGKGGNVDLMSFSHADEDHIQGASEVFYLLHAKKYQDVDRVKMKVMCVPAHFILESNRTMSTEGRILQTEARHRLKEGKNIIVLSEPDALNDWIEENADDPDSSKSCIVTAGTLLPVSTMDEDGAEVFVHSPFSYQHDDGDRQDRNDESSVFHITMDDGYGEKSKVLLTADVSYEVIADMVKATEKHGNIDRLEADYIVVPHHGSYHSLMDEKDGEVDEDVDRLYKKYANEGVTIVVSSRTEDESADDDQPPHAEAIKYYREVAKDRSGEAIITMEHPTKNNPKPVQIGKSRKRLGSSSYPSPSSGASGVGGGGAVSSLFPRRRESPGFG